MKYFLLFIRLYNRKRKSQVGDFTITITEQEDEIMSQKQLFINEQTYSAPNILIADMGGSEKNSGKALAKMLSCEEINVCLDISTDRIFSEEPKNGWHMVIIRDGGIEAPAFGEITKLHNASNIPIMTVSDNCTEIYRIMALDKGADICMDAEDFGTFEFKARLVTMLRRHLHIPSVSLPVSVNTADTLRNGTIILDRRSREVFKNGSRIKLTAIEYGIIEYLMENCGDVCTIDDIYRQVWHENPYSVKKTVVEHIRRIRTKIESDPHNPKYIKAVFGVGYRMERAAG